MKASRHVRRLYCTDKEFRWNLAGLGEPWFTSTAHCGPWPLRKKIYVAHSRIHCKPWHSAAGSVVRGDGRLLCFLDTRRAAVASAHRSAVPPDRRSRLTSFLRRQKIGAEKRREDGDHKRRHTNGITRRWWWSTRRSTGRSARIG